MLLNERNKTFWDVMPWCIPCVWNVNDMNDLSILILFFFSLSRYSFYRFTSKYFFYYYSNDLLLFFVFFCFFMIKTLFILDLYFASLILPWRTVADFARSCYSYRDTDFSILNRFFFFFWVYICMSFKTLLKCLDCMVFYILLDNTTNVCLGLKQSTIQEKTKLA